MECSICKVSIANTALYKVPAEENEEIWLCAACRNGQVHHKNRNCPEHLFGLMSAGTRLIGMMGKSAGRLPHIPHPGKSIFPGSALLDKVRKISSRFAWTVIAAILFSACSRDNDDDNNNLSSKDREFMRKAAQANLAETEAGDLAASKGDSSSRWFGQMMMMDHNMAQSELRTLSEKHDTEIPSSPDSAHIAIKQQLTMLSGRTFDSAYLHIQVKDHQDAVNLFRDEANNGNAADLRNYAQKYLPKIEGHLHMADSLAGRF